MEAQFQSASLRASLAPEVISELDVATSMGLLSLEDLDSRAVDAIKELSSEDAVAVIKDLCNCNMEHVSNKSAFLCGLIKTNRQKSRRLSRNGLISEDATKKFGPDEAKIKEVLDRTGYTLEVSTGQRKYGGPPPNWTDAAPGSGNEIYCGKIPKDLYEDTLVPLFEKYGIIWDLRLMMDPITGRNRGYCFVTFVETKSAEEAVIGLNDFEVRPGKKLKVNVSVANVRLFVGNIPKNRTRDELFEEFKKHTEGLQDIIIYNSPDDPKKKNRGFAFLDYDSHKSASAAKRHIVTSRLHLWGLEVIVDWAEPLDEPDDETMAKVKVLYVRNLKADITEESLKEKFEEFGAVERVKKVKGYGFVHFVERESALKAMQDLNHSKIGDLEVEISLAKPLSKNKNKDRKRFGFNWNNNFYGGFAMYPQYQNGRFGSRGRSANGRGNGRDDEYYRLYYDFAPGDYYYPGSDGYNYGYFGGYGYNARHGNGYNQRRGEGWWAGGSPRGGYNQKTRLANRAPRYNTAAA